MHLIEDLGYTRVLRGWFWSSRQRAGHSLHEVPYRASFKPALVSFLLDNLPHDSVYDPFMGRGTVLLEAALSGAYYVAGRDLNPVSPVLTMARLRPPEMTHLEWFLDNIPWDSEPRGGHDTARVEPYFHPDTLRQLLVLREHLGRDSVSTWVKMVVCSRLHGHSPGYMSRRTMPPNAPLPSPERQERLNADNTPDEPKDVRKIILRKSTSLMRDLTHDCLTELDHTRVDVGVGNARFAPNIPPVSLVITSPPFLSVVNYQQDHWLRAWWLGVNPPPPGKFTPDGWRRLVRQSLHACAQVVRPGGFVCYEVGDVRGQNLYREVEGQACYIDNLRLVGTLINEQTFTKVSHTYGVSNNETGTNTNQVVIFRRV